MSTWYKVAWIPPLFAAVDKVAPGRGHAEDGTIGDLTHASGTSGHNPDDTPGVTAERQDADSKPEVRAADVDSLGTWPAGVSMERVVQAVLHGPAAERDRLIYVIYNRRIWRKAGGWKQETYTGSDPHDKHAHFSGDPAADDDGRAWTSIENLGDNVSDLDAKLPDPWTENGHNALAVVMELRKAHFVADDATGYGAPKPESFVGKVYRFFGLQKQSLDEIKAKVDGLAAGQVSQEAVNAAVAAALADPAVVASLVKAINDDAAARAAQ